MSDLPQYVLDRSFKAPRATVWKTFSDPELLARWYGPGVETIIHKFDLKAGGQWLNEMRMKGNSMYSVQDFKEVIDLEKIVFHQGNSDADWNVTSNPMMPDWPQILHTEITFVDEGADTQMKLVWTPHEASDGEIACFANAVSQMGRGWEAGMSIIDEILTELQA